MLPWKDTSLQTRIVGTFPLLACAACMIIAAYVMFLH